MSNHLMCNGSYLYIVLCNILTPIFDLVSSMKSASMVILVLMTSVYASPIQRRELEEMASKSKLQLVEENAFFYIILKLSISCQQLWFSILTLDREQFELNEAPKNVMEAWYAINVTIVFTFFVHFSAHTTIKPDYNAILHQLGEYFKGRDLQTRQLAPVAGDATVARDDILHELGEYWKGRIAALSALLSQHNIQQHIHVFSQLLNNQK